MVEPLRNLETLQDDGEFLVFRTVRDDELMIAIRPSSRGASGAAAQLTNAYSLRDQLDAAWAVRPRALEDHHGTPTLLVDDPGGELMSRRIARRPDLTEWLRVAIGATGTLRELHARGIVHRNVKPSHLFVTQAGEVRITGFGLASRVPPGGIRPPPDIAIGTLAYMPPEQTGRIDRPIDARSDLYSLGITLYELATGALPFVGADAMEWIHAHLARTPPPLGNVPAVIGAIVCKLLAKTPDERYQSAAGLEADLRKCQYDWETLGLIERFPLGDHDPSERLLLRAKLYGREPALELLRTTFERVARLGAPELMLISGYAGIGKSTVGDELNKLVADRATFSRGKSEQFHRDVPYATVAQALQLLVRQTLGRSAAVVERTRAALVAALGPNGQIAVDLAPELAILLGPQPPAVELPPPDARARFRSVLGRLLGVFARHQHPLVLFLDDLQWADPATLEVLSDLLTSTELRDVLVVGAVRDDEVAAGHPVRRAVDAIRVSGAVVQELALPPLVVDDVVLLVADAMQCTEHHVRALAEIVHAKTGGNPFFAIQFLRALVDELLVVFDRGQATWVWDLERVRNKGITDNVVDLLARRLDRFRPATQRILQILAYLGHGTSTATLASIYGDPAADFDALLWEVTTAGLVVRRDDHYAFIHDRVQEAAYALVPTDVRDATHLAIGRALLARTGPGELDAKIFDIVDQLMRGVALIDDAGERIRTAELLLLAGRRAHAASAFTSSLKYLAAARELAGEAGLDVHYRLAFATELLMAECEFLTTGSAAAQRLAALATRARGNVDLAAVTYLRVMLAATQDLRAANEIGLDHLRLVGIDWSHSPSEREVVAEHERMWQLIGPRETEDLIDLPTMTDPAWSAIMDVLLATLAHAVFTSPTLHDIIVLRMINISLEHGNCDASCLAYAEATMVLGPRFGNPGAGYRFTRMGYRLVERGELDKFKQRVYLLLAYHVVPWSGDVRDSLSLLRRSLEAARQAGDFTFTCYSLNHLISSRIARADPLAEVQREAETGLAYVRAARFGLLVDCFAGQLCLIASLRGIEPEWTAFGQSGERALEAHFAANPDRAIAGCWYWVRKLAARVFAHDVVAALAAARAADRLLWTTSSHFERAEYAFFAALTYLATGDRDAGWRLRGELAGWAAYAPATFADRVELVDAELARLDGRITDAEQHYERATQRARDRELHHHEALGCELAARFYHARELVTIAASYLGRARACYARWGAAACVRRIDQRHAALLGRAADAPAEIALARQLDIDAVVKMSQVVSSEIVLDKLLSRLMALAVEHAGAGRGLMILSNGPLRIVAEAVSSAGELAVHVGSEPVTHAQLPASIINYVVRTHDLTLLDDVAQPSAFSDDEYLRTSAPRALLCLPLVKYGALVGVLYLENHLTTHVFTADRLSILKLLASQAAISLDNARLYAERQQAEMFLEEAQRLSRTGSFGWNVRTGALTWSAETYQIFGYSAETEPMLDKVFARLHPDDRERVVHRMERVAREPTEWETKHRIVMPDGTIKHVHVVARPIDNTGTHDVDYVGAVMDVTRERMAEELRRAKESAETANRAKDLFMANVSHELRTPLNAILGMTELVLDGRITDDQRTSLATVKSAADSLAVILDDLLDFAKIEAGKLALDATELSLSAVVRDVVRPFAVRAEHKGLALVCELASDVPDPLVGDVLRLRQVLTNLLGNAIKFTAAGTVVIEIGMIERATDEVTLRFAVRDTGIGIAADKQVVIFQAFEQADPSTTRRHGGTGLGLTIASRIVGLMGGTLAVESAVGRGSTFWFTARFPVPVPVPPADARIEAADARIEAAHAPAEPPAIPAPPSTSALRALRVLVAEDNDLNIVLMRQLLATRGHDARFATTGLEAIAEAAEHAFDVLLLDVHLPEADGFQVIEAIRRREHTTGERLTVIAMTARSRKEDREACLAAGMDAFLPKPIHAVDLWAALDRVGQLVQRPARQLVDPRVLLASCGGDAVTLTGIGAALAALLPDDLASVRRAFERRDARRLHHAAHKLVTTVSTFSSTLGLLAKTLEAHARAGDLSTATAGAIDELAAAGPELIREVVGLTIEGLRARLRDL